MPTPAEQSEQRIDMPSRGWATGLPLAVLWLLALLAGGTEPDRAILRNLHVGDGTWLEPTLFVTRLGDWEVLVALTLFASAWLLFRGHGRLVTFLLGSTLLARVAIGVQKMLLARVRPAELEQLVEVETLSFPSGHAANSMVVYVTLALLLVRDESQRRAAVIAAVALSLLVGISRVLLGVHWPSDVIGGWAFGLLWVLVAWRAKQRWRFFNS